MRDRLIKLEDRLLETFRKHCPAPLWDRLKALGTDRVFGLFFIGSGVACLAAAAFAQYVLGIYPCLLCYIQRIPYLVLGLVGIAVLLRWGPQTRRRLLVCFTAGLFALNFGVAVTQVGMEQKWWVGPSVCSADLSQDLKMSDMRMTKGGLPPCGEVQAIFGIPNFTFAVLNLVGSPFMCFICLIAFSRERWWNFGKDRKE